MVTLKSLWKQLMHGVGSVGERLDPVDLLQGPRFDLLTPEAGNTHFHVVDWESMLDYWACLPYPDKRIGIPRGECYCRRHFEGLEKYQGMLNLTGQCDRYHVEVANGCHEPCVRCDAEKKVLAALLERFPSP